MFGLVAHAAAYADEPVPTPETATQQPIPLRLLGTILGRENGIAICFDQATTKVIRLKSGQSFDGWVLRSVQGHNATFEKGAQRTVIELSTPADPLQATAFQPLPGAIVASPPPQNVAVHAPVAPVSPQGGTWMDGDGQMIDPPRKSP